VFCFVSFRIDIVTSVTQPPHFSSQAPPEIAFREHEAVQLPCEAAGIPPPM